MSTSRNRKRDVTDEDISDLLSDLGHYRQQTQESIELRVAQPLTGHSFEVRIDDLEPDPNQPRRHFTETTLRALSESIADQGVLQPLVIRPTDGGRYLIVAGERRFRAARMAGLGTVPCIVKAYNDDQALAVALTENIHRDDLSDMEKSDALVRLRDLTPRSWKEIAEAVRLSHDRVMQLASLQTLAPEVQAGVRARVLSGRKALALRPLPPSEQAILAQEAAVQGWSAEEIRTRVQQQRGKSARSSNRNATPANKSVTRNGFVVDTTVTPEPSLPFETLIETNYRPPAVLANLHEQLGLGLQLLRSTGPDLLDPAFRQELLTQLQALQALLSEDPNTPLLP